MKILKENMFLVVTAATVLVVGSVLLLVSSSKGSQTDVSVEAYASMCKKISSLAFSGINEDKVKAAKQRVEKIRYQAKEVADESLLRNCRDYEVLSFDISGKAIPAFPVDPKFKDRETLRLLFPEKYRLRLKAIRETLTPTVPPTDEEIKLEIARIAASVMPAEKEDQPVLTGTPREVERYRDERIGRYGLGGPAGERSPAGGLTGTGAGQTAVEQQALINLVIGKSEQGWIYADEEQQGDRSSASGGTSNGGAMDDALPPGRTDYDDNNLWLAQVGLWVQQDIVEAINLTNRRVQKTASGDQQGVAASAVKRLMSINIRGYVFGGAGTDDDRTATLRYLDIGERRESKPAPQLTGRACNKLYDVVHYEFTVVLPMRHLLVLQKNLMAQNYHTVLEVGIVRPMQSNIHYYGTDSVMKVTIVGEMLMLADWTRGRWDKDAKAWNKSYPALVPGKFLEKMREMDPGAIRDEDNQRLKSPKDHF